MSCISNVQEVGQKTSKYLVINSFLLVLDLSEGISGSLAAEGCRQRSKPCRHLTMSVCKSERSFAACPRWTTGSFDVNNSSSRGMSRGIESAENIDRLVGWQDGRGLARIASPQTRGQLRIATVDRMLARISCSDIHRAQLPGQLYQVKASYHEENLSAESDKTASDARIPRTHEDPLGSSHFESATRKGT